MTRLQARALLSCFVLAVAVTLAGCDGSAPLSTQQNPEEAPTTRSYDRSSGPIPGQYIVVLDDKALQAKSRAAVRSAARTLLQGTGATPTKTYATALRGFTATGLSEEQAARLRSDPQVRLVEQDQFVKLSPPPGAGPGGGDDGSSGETTPYGVTRVGGPTSGVSGTAWVLDTGIDLDHPDLNVDKSRSAVFVSKGPGSKTPNDKDGHGTHVAGTIAAIDNSRDVVGVTEGVAVVAVKVLDDNGRGSYSDIIDGVDYVAANAAQGDVANMSLGGGPSDALDTAVENAASKGIYFSIAAGNDSDDANNYSPARTEAPNVYTVSAFDSTDTFASFSNFSGPTDPPIEYGGPGVDVLSLYADGGTATLSGTSMSAPHVAGVLLATGGSPSTDGTVSSDPDGDPDPIPTN
ncbi:MAG: S8 family serine peptidase [Salinibacter sp.]